jgi:biotin operon repressor
MSNVAEKFPTATQWVLVKNAHGHFSTHQIDDVGRVQDGSRNKVAREAVLAHIKVLRKLGQTRVNTREIASALNLPHALVEQAATQLKDQGVKPAK